MGRCKNNGGEKYTLMYADDMVMMAEEEMKAMLSKLERYLDGKRLELNVEKAKIINYRKGGGKEKKINWQ